jgi:hypothetical protein
VVALVEVEVEVEVAVAVEQLRLMGLKLVFQARSQSCFFHDLEHLYDLNHFVVQLAVTWY